MHEHVGTWFNALEPLIPESLRGTLNPTLLGAFTVIAILLILVRCGTRAMQQVPRGWQNFWEWTYEVFRGFAVSVMGPSGEKHMPLLATCFIFIFSMNVFGIIPGFVSPTTSINMTAALALTVFFLIQYYGVKAHGARYFLHFFGDAAFPGTRSPLLIGVNLVLYLMNVVIHVIGELAKPLSLTFRLFGNIFGEETVVAELTKLAVQITKAIYIPIPIQLVMVAFAVFGAFIQALIFTMLTAVYISLAAGGEEHGHGEEHAPASTEQAAEA